MDANTFGIAINISPGQAFNALGSPPEKTKTKETIIITAKIAKPMSKSSICPTHFSRQMHE